MEPDKQLTIVLPSAILHPALAQKGVPRSLFLLGHRNVIVQGQWRLIESSRHCAQAWVLDLLEIQLPAIQAIVREGETLQLVQSSYIQLHVQGYSCPEEPLTKEKVEQLLKAQGGVNKIALNLIRNAFYTFSDYRKAVLQEIENSLVGEEKVKEEEISDKVQRQFHAQRLTGANLMKVPAVNKQTGIWDEQNTIPLKLIEH